MTGMSGSGDVEPRLDAIAVARDLLSRFDVRRPREIDVELMAYKTGAVVLWRDAGSADARVVLSGDNAYLSIAKEAHGTPRARFSIAHELAHFLLHKGHFDAIARIHGAPRIEGREHKIEAQADKCAAEILVPEALAAPFCTRPCPSLDDVGELATIFNVSLTVAAKKWARLSPAGCAFVESRGGVIKRAIRSPGFRGEALQRHPLGERTLALALNRAGGDGGHRVHEIAWGSARAGRPIVEESVPLGDGAPGGAVLTWLAHE